MEIAKLRVERQDRRPQRLGHKDAEEWIRRHSPDLLGQLARQQVVPEEPERIGKTKHQQECPDVHVRPPSDRSPFAPVAPCSTTIPTAGKVENGASLHSKQGRQLLHYLTRAAEYNSNLWSHAG